MQQLRENPSPDSSAQSVRAGALSANLSALWLPLCWAAVFVFSLAINVWFNFCTVHADCSLSCDASEYVRDANGLLRLATDFVAAQMNQGLPSFAVSADAAKSLRELTQGGPIYPAFIAFCFLISSSHASWAPVLGQCLLAAVSAVLVGDIARRAWNFNTGVVAAVMQSVYPAFVINTGRLYSESFSVFLFSLCLWFSVRAVMKHSSPSVSGKTNHAIVEIFILGATLYALQLTRSVSIVFTALSAVFSIFAYRGKRVLATIVFVVGIFAVLVPWMALQNAVIGKSSAFVDRVGQYNAFIGNNTQTEGWLSFPYPDGHGIEKLNITKVITDSYKESPSRWLLLLLDKPVRLFKFPWNDFRVPLGPIAFPWQVLIHQLILALALVGVPMSCVMTKETSKEQMMARAFLACSMAVSLSYLFFITVPRYNLQFMPIAIMTAAFAVCALVRRAKADAKSAALFVSLFAVAICLLRADVLPFIMSVVGSAETALFIAVGVKIVALCATGAGLIYLLTKEFGAGKTSSRVSRFVAAAICCMVTPFACFPLRAHGLWYEWRSPFDQAGQEISQTILIPQAQFANTAQHQCYLMIDADGASSIGRECEIVVNGVKVNAPVIPGIALTQDYKRLRHRDGSRLYWEGEYILGCMTPLLQQCNSDLRQWFFVPLSTSVLETSKAVPGTASAFEVRVTLRRLAAVPGAAIFGHYALNGPQIVLPSPHTVSWEKAFYGVEYDRGLTDSRLDCKMPAASVSTAADLSSEPGLQNGAYSIRLLVTGDEPCVKMLAEMPIELTREGGAVFTGHVNQVPSVQENKLWCVNAQSHNTRESDSRVLRRAQIAFDGRDQSGNFSYRSPWFPRLSKTGLARFSDYWVPVEPSQLPGLSAIDMSFTEKAGRSILGNSADSDNGKLSLNSWEIPAEPLKEGASII